VGPSGAGKSTLASLLFRFWDFSQGYICLDGRSIKEYASDEVRQKIAFISPGTYLFNTSIFENLRMARRRVTRAEVEKAAQAAQIHDFIVKLPNGYDTLIGEQGVRLSGGERQRLAIARAILKDAPILVLDEPTANLDTLTEASILTSLFELARTKTTLLITHRLVGLENVDEILFLEHGRIVERGSQVDLLQQDSSYRRFWELQNRFLSEP
jgi:ABC-type multidrug transport system fused ATPase/permease subunit